MCSPAQSLVYHQRTSQRAGVPQLCLRCPSKGALRIVSVRCKQLDIDEAWLFLAEPTPLGLRWECCAGCLMLEVDVKTSFGFTLASGCKPTVDARRPECFKCPSPQASYQAQAHDPQCAFRDACLPVRHGYKSRLANARSSSGVHPCSYLPQLISNSLPWRTLPAARTVPTHRGGGVADVPL